MKTARLIFSTCFLLFFYSCKKDAAKNEDSLKLLTQQPWKLTAQQYNADNYGWFNSYNSYQSCQLDNITSYATNMTVVTDEGPSKCDPLLPQVISSGTWTFNPDHTKFSVTEGADVYTYTVLQLDEHTLKTSLRITTSFHSTVYENTYSH